MGLTTTARDGSPFLYSKPSDHLAVSFWGVELFRMRRDVLDAAGIAFNGEIKTPILVDAALPPVAGSSYFLARSEGWRKSRRKKVACL